MSKTSLRHRSERPVCITDMFRAPVQDTENASGTSDQPLRLNMCPSLTLPLLSGWTALRSHFCFVDISRYTLSWCCVPDVIMPNSPTSNTLQPVSSNDENMGFKSTFYHLPSFIFFLFIASSVYISARPISNISVNNLNTSIGCDEGNIGEGNEFNVKGQFNTFTLWELELTLSVGSCGEFYNTIVSDFYSSPGDKGENVSLGEISNIHVSGTNRGCIGGNNNYTVTGERLISDSFLMFRGRYSTDLSMIKKIQSVLSLCFSSTNPSQDRDWQCQ